MKSSKPFSLTLAILLVVNLVLFGFTAPGARACTECADGYGECFLDTGTDECFCAQMELHDCDLCAVDPCSSAYPDDCGGDM